MRSLSLRGLLRVSTVPAILVAFMSFGATATYAQTMPERSGFTLLLNLGVGLQDDGALPDSEIGLAGLNLGIGGFLTPSTALWFRVSGTNASYDFGFGDGNQISGFAGPAIQHWLTPRFAIEGGVGAGFWDFEGADDQGLGLLLAANYVVWTNGGHSLNVGLEYAPALTDPETVHNFGLVFGWQKN